MSVLILLVLLHHHQGALGCERAAAQGGALRLVQRVDFAGRPGAAPVAHRAGAGHGPQQGLIVVGLDVGPGALDRLFILVLLWLDLGRTAAD